MLRLPTINYNGGRRTHYDVEVKVKKITPERHWINLWIKKTMKIGLEVISVPDGTFENIYGHKIDFPKMIIIHDFAKEFSTISIDDVFKMQIGYADQQQQYWHGVNAFSISINEEKLQVI